MTGRRVRELRHSPRAAVSPARGGIGSKLRRPDVADPGGKGTTRLLGCVRPRLQPSRSTIRRSGVTHRPEEINSSFEMPSEDIAGDQRRLATRFPADQTASWWSTTATRGAGPAQRAAGSHRSPRPVISHFALRAPGGSEEVGGCDRLSRRCLRLATLGVTAPQQSQAGHGGSQHQQTGRLRYRRSSERECRIEC